MENLIAAIHLLRSDHCFNLVSIPKAREWSEKIADSTCLHQQEEQPAAQGVVTTAWYEKQVA